MIVNKNRYKERSKVKRYNFLFRYEERCEEDIKLDIFWLQGGSVGIRQFGCSVVYMQDVGDVGSQFLEGGVESGICLQK